MKNRKKILTNSLLEFLIYNRADSLILEKSKKDNEKNMFDDLDDESDKDENEDESDENEDESDKDENEDEPIDDQLPEDFEDEPADEESSEEDEEDEEPEKNKKELEDVSTNTKEQKILDDDSLDRALNDVFLEFEKLSIIPENKRFLSLKILLEKSNSASAIKIDIDKFAEETARLIKNYNTLLDMEAIIFNKAKEYLLNKGYDKKIINKFKRLLSDRHDLDFFKDDDPTMIPTAVGARGGSSGGAM